MTEISTLGVNSTWGLRSALALTACLLAGLSLPPDAYAESTLIRLRDQTIDTSGPIPAPPSGLSFLVGEGERQLQLIQFTGKARDEWLGALRERGAEPLAYVPDNAYLVWGEPAAFTGMTVAIDIPAQVVLPYQPEYKLDAFTRRAAGTPSEEIVHVTVQFVDHPGVGDSVAQLREAADEITRETRTSGRFVTVVARVRAERLPAIAQGHDVVNVERWVEPKLTGERQGQVLAGNLNPSGTAPSGPGYLAWLTGLGLAGPMTFTVDVSDSGLDRGSTAAANLHADFLDASGNGRVTYVRRVSGSITDGSQAANIDTIGHGTIDHAIVGGFNDTQADAAFEDSGGFQFGLGIAPGVRLGSSQIFSPAWTSPDFTVLQSTASQAGAVISSNSWGSTIPSAAYDTTSQEYDGLVRDADPTTPGNQQMVIVFAAGNDGPNARTLGDRGSTGKNTFVVGASENFNATGDVDNCMIGDGGADNLQDIIGFSSRGPVATSGRFKPDIVAPGTHVFGAASQASGFNGAGVCGGPLTQPDREFYPAGQTLYTWSSGTSHACPAASGGAALLRQSFLNASRQPPSPAMTKAYLMNSARYLSGAGASDTLPSNAQGMGLMDLGRAFDATPRELVDESVVFDGITTPAHVVTGHVQSAGEPFRVTLAWTDAPGSPITGGALVNDLDLRVELSSDGFATSDLYLGNRFNGASSRTGGTADSANNAESVFLSAGTCGEYRVTVAPAAINGDGIPNNADPTDQDFALVVYNGASGAGCTLPPRRKCSSMTIADPRGPWGPPLYLAILLLPLVYIWALRLRVRRRVRVG